MTKDIENSLSMFKTVKAVCDNNIALINANVGLQSTYADYVHLLGDMDILGQNQTKDRRGITKDKQNAREKLELAIEAASGIIKAQFDHDNKEVEYYCFTDFKLIGQLTDADFDVSKVGKKK